MIISRYLTGLDEQTMSKGIVIFAYNSKLDYVSIATIAAQLAKKHLGLPVTLITDTEEVDYDVFDNVIIQQSNSRGQRVFKFANRTERTVWHNQNRSNAYELSPYDQTLLIDADYLIFNNSLAKLFDTNLEFACYDRVHELSGWTSLQNGARVGDPGIHMQWATVVYFTKCELAENVFGFMQTIKENYGYYSGLYNFSMELFRNDYTLSIALQVLTGYNQNNFTQIPGTLISANTPVEIAEARPNGEVVLTWTESNGKKKVTKVTNTNIHIMNKDSIINPVILSQLRELAQ